MRVGGHLAREQPAQPVAVLAGVGIPETASRCPQARQVIRAGPTRAWRTRDRRGPRAARAVGDAAAEKAAIAAIDGFESHVVPIIADIDAGFGNEHATYLLAKDLIKAGACCLQIENQVSYAKQCGHQDGKVTVPREDFIEKLRACRLAFEELGVDDGVVVARTDSLGAGLTQNVPVSQQPGDLAWDYLKWLKVEPII
ncbi:isocitrate lyase/phosphoenolpyruvate mutase family protein [Rhodovulum euryhalinum]|uniref:Isocitrate lyase n=1 Tax=Rhodovulum euryhalinum TaxID=35805 RepID=A0A4R2K9N4_9RHOB|nr:isocitrate lyase/phosphoenolpyruvate mutase family protein [Rhodovulum euryhalinum]TCO69454.1 isocitrate lyase family protein [Rhodovulum euryhalinum]